MGMEVSNVSQINGKNKKDALKQKQDAAVQRVQTEYLRQISEGKEHKKAILDSLKAIDEKYNPQQDEVKLSRETVSDTQMTSIKKPTTQDIKRILELTDKGLDAIAKIVPKLIVAFELIKELLDKLFPSKDKEQNMPCNAAA